MSFSPFYKGIVDVDKEHIGVFDMPPPYAFTFWASDIHDIQIHPKKYTLIYNKHDWECEEKCYYFDIVISK
jgi:hypothetical protein